MTTKMTPAQAMTASLQALAENQRPLGGYPQLLEAAQALTATSAAQAVTILGVLGTSQYARMPVPPPPGLPPSFPADHLMHLEYSNEWYWVSANLVASDGVTQIGVLSTIHRSRLFAQDIQAEAGWSDAESQVVNSETTVAVNDGTRRFLARRTGNVKWLIGGDDVVFPTLGAPFALQCGADSMTSPSDQVLPLRVQARDDQMAVDITLSTDMQNPAWFLQGINGRTAPPRPGIYYSWPQLSVSGTVEVHGVTYQVSGTGWIDHQLMMGTPPSPTIQPPPVQPPLTVTHDRTFGSWQWCQFNFDNGDAYTGVTFQSGPFRANLISPLGYYVRKVNGAWAAQLVEAEWRLDGFIATLFDVIQPTEWTYRIAGLSTGGGDPINATIVATPLVADGSFVVGNQQVCSEVAASVFLSGTLGPAGPLLVGGAGYCETVGAEINANYSARALAFLAGSGGSAGSAPR